MQASRWLADVVRELRPPEAKAAVGSFLDDVVGVPEVLFEGVHGGHQGDKGVRDAGVDAKRRQTSGDSDCGCVEEAASGTPLLTWCMWRIALHQISKGSQ